LVVERPVDREPTSVARPSWDDAQRKWGGVPLMRHGPLLSQGFSCEYSLATCPSSCSADPRICWRCSRRGCCKTILSTPFAGPPVSIIPCATSSLHSSTHSTTAPHLEFAERAGFSQSRVRNLQNHSSDRNEVHTHAARLGCVARIRPVQWRVVRSQVERGRPTHRINEAKIPSDAPNCQGYSDISSRKYRSN